jgi:hypothetical protein
LIKRSSVFVSGRLPSTSFCCRSNIGRLIKGKITFVHRRMWPALVRAAGRLPSDRLSQVREVHMKSGQHVTKEVPFPDWVPSSVRAAARRLSEEAALAEFTAWLE